MQAQIKEKIVLTKIQQEVLYGALLGDGSLQMAKRGVNANFCYLSKSSSHVKYVMDFFKDFWIGKEIKNSQYFDKRTCKKYHHSYLRTYTNATFTEEYFKWYKNNKKHIPKDLKLTPMICLIWYIGDGGICHTKRSEHIKLSTQCFSKEELENILLPQLKRFEASLMKSDIGKDKKQQYFIYIPHRKEKDFLNYIGKCPFDEYQYKWNIKEYIYTIPTCHKENEQKFCEMYQNNMSYYAIAKLFKVEPAAVKYYLIKNNIYYPSNSKTKNTIIHLSKSGEYLNIYNSMNEAAKALKISVSKISNVKRNKTKMKDGSFFVLFSDFDIQAQEAIQEKFKEYFIQENKTE